MTLDREGPTEAARRWCEFRHALARAHVALIERRRSEKCEAKVFTLKLPVKYDPAASLRGILDEAVIPHGDDWDARYALSV